jgi:hypothetical protein
MMAILEHAIQVRRDEKFLHEFAAGNGIFDFVFHECAALMLFEGVLVNPKGVWTSGLAIDKSSRWLPLSDLALPTYRKTAYTQPVMKHRTSLHGRRRRSQNLEVEPGWRNTIQIVRIAEELKDSIPTLR